MPFILSSASKILSLPSFSVASTETLFFSYSSFPLANSILPFSISPLAFLNSALLLDSPSKRLAFSAFSCFSAASNDAFAALSLASPSFSSASLDASSIFAFSKAGFA